MACFYPLTKKKISFIFHAVVILLSELELSYFCQAVVLHFRVLGSYFFSLKVYSLLQWESKLARDQIISIKFA